MDRRLCWMRMFIGDGKVCRARLSNSHRLISVSICPLIGTKPVNPGRPRMLVLQAVPVREVDAFKLLRARIRDASTWDWGNKARTRLKHVQRPSGGHIQISNAGGVLVA